VRVHELARELGVASKDILAALEEMGLEGRTALSSVPEEAVPRLRASGGRPVPGGPGTGTEASEPVMPRSPGPSLGPPPALRPSTRAARAARTPLFRTRQDRVMAAAALLLFAGSFSTFAILGRDPARSVTRVFPHVVLPVSQPRPSPAGGDLATLEAPPAAEPSPSPSPRLRLARGAGIASSAAARSLLPPVSEPPTAEPAAVQPTKPPPPPTVRPSPPAPTTDPPEPPPPPTTDPPEPPPTTDPPEPSPSPTESPSPSPSDDDD
jgi:translation initiation factor IF-2-like protein